MNYGKTAYLKVLELEKELNQSKTEDSTNSYLEIIKPDINQLLTKQSNIQIKLPQISVESEKTICFQIKATFSCTSSTEINSFLEINQTLLHQESKLLTTGENDFVIFKTFTPISTGIAEPIIEFTTQTDSPQTTLMSIKIIILGAKGDSVHTDIEMRGLFIESQNKSLISYIDDNKLYYTFESLEEKTLPTKNFTHLCSAISHCFCLDCYSEENQHQDIVLYRVDTNGNLYYSKPFINLNDETLIDRDVSVVYACASPISSDENNIAVYIKNGTCYYISRKNNSFTTPKTLSLPQGKYIDIRAVSHIESDFLYVFASHENGSNYILRSTEAISTGKIVELLKMSYETIVTKYIDVSVLTDDAIENLTLNIEPLVNSFIDYNSIFKKVSKSTLSLSCEIDASEYKFEFNGIYGIKLDKNILTAGKWESYTDDAINFEGAYMDFENDKFVDNGWLNRWPFNEIRPCLLKDGNVIGYLDPNDYTKFEDGSAANIYDNTFGEVMVEIPKIYYKLSTDDNYIYVQISKKAREGFTDRAFWHSGHDNEKIYVGAYLSGDSYLTSKGLYSNSNCTLNNYYTISYAGVYPYKVQFNSPNVEFLPFNVLTLLQCLYLIMFKSTDSNKSLGLGMGSVQTNYTTGTGNTKGMYYGQNSTLTPIKCFGLEDIYGTRQVIVTGFYIDNSGNPRFVDVYDPNSSYNPTNITSFGALETALNLGTLRTGVLTTITGHNEVGFMDKVDNKITDATLGFTDHCFTLKNTTCVIHGLIRTDAGYGIFNTKTARQDAYDQNWSFRLVYYPNLNT